MYAHLGKSARVAEQGQAAVVAPVEAVVHAVDLPELNPHVEGDDGPDEEADASSEVGDSADEDEDHDDRRKIADVDAVSRLGKAEADAEACEELFLLSAWSGRQKSDGCCEKGGRWVSWCLLLAR